MSAPTSVPRATSSRKERKPKLRASCDSCAASKIKCSKEHPICARCSANGLPCVYGVSRKHGKPGRTRKKHSDGTPFVKVSKQRSSQDSSKFSRFEVHPDSALQQLPDTGTPSSWSWSPTPSLSTTPEFDSEMTPEPPYMNMDASDLTLMDESLLQLDMEPTQSVESNLLFRDPFPKSQPVQMDLLDLQALKDYIGGDLVNPMEYTFTNTTCMDSLQSCSAISSPQSPKSLSMNSYNATVDTTTPTTHCCYTLAYSTLESLKVITTDTTHAYPGIQSKSLNSTLAVTRRAMQSVLQLLSCPCATDPHLAMLYSSITSKMLSWYRVAAGVDASLSSGTSHTSSSSSSGLSSPSVAPGVEEELSFDAHMQPLRFGAVEFEELQQERLKRRVVLGELRECGQLVEALANWRGEGMACEQAEFLYDVLGAWLKSELYKTVKEIEAVDAL